MKPAKTKITRLKRLRAKSRLTLKLLSERSGIDQATISLAENGRRRPYLTTLQALADALTEAFKEQGKDITVELEDLIEPDKPTA
jgi:transcriptional regulator with XRE-family HTH domain